MAAALSLTSAQSALLQYRWVCDGTGGASASRTQAQLIEDCGVQRQPTLKALLAAAQTDEAWLALNTSLALAATPVTVTRRVTLTPQFAVTPEGGHSLEIVSDNQVLGMAAIDVRLPG